MRRTHYHHLFKQRYRRRGSSVFFFLLIMLLSSCGNWDVRQRVEMTPGFEPTILGFEVEDGGGIIITSHVLRFTSRAGSLGARVTGYRVEYLDPAGNPIRVGDSILFSRGSLSALIPPGIVCDASPGGQLAEGAVPCSMTSPGASFADVTSAPVNNTVTLPGPIALRVLTGQQVGSRANFFFSVITNLNERIELGPYEVAISFPVE